MLDVRADQPSRGRAVTCSHRHKQLTVLLGGGDESPVLHEQAEMQAKDSVTGMQGRTEGLLQLAYEDQKRYSCDFDYDADRKLKTGDPERTTRRKRTAEGIPVDDGTWKQLMDLADSLGIKWDQG